MRRMELNEEMLDAIKMLTRGDVPDNYNVVPIPHYVWDYFAREGIDMRYFIKQEKMK